MAPNIPVRAPSPRTELSPLGVVFWSVYLPGQGQFRLGKRLRGAGVFLLFFGFIVTGPALLSVSSSISGLYIPLIILIYLWNLYDAYHCTVEYNENLVYEVIEARYSKAPKINPLYDYPQADTIASVGPADREPSASHSRFCPFCGKPVSRPDSKFCQYCGKKTL